MIIGNGLIAQTFMDYKYRDDVVIFASGVSDSVNSGEKDFNREEKLLKMILNEYPQNLFIYFSSCDIVNPIMNNKPYYKHKMRMENLIITMTKNYYIFRLPQVVGHRGNNNNLINFFINKIKHKERLLIYPNVWKSIIGIADVFRMSQYIIDSKCYPSSIINITNPNNLSIKQIIQKIECYLNKKALVDEDNKVEVNPVYDCKISIELAQILDINFGDEYLDKILCQYDKEKQ